VKLIWGDYPIELNLLFCKKLPNHEYSQNLLSAVTHLGLTSAEIPVLALRLDRVEPVVTTIALGGEIDLPDSPVLSLTRCYPNRTVVLVVDQLDFVSTTSGRNPDFFDTLSALCDEVRGLRQFQTIHLVLACREFDFNHDHRFRQCLEKDKKPVVVNKFTVEEVKKTIGSCAACEVAQQNLAQSACREWCSHALTHLFADPEVEIRRRAAAAFWNLWQIPEESLLPYTELMDAFIKSAAFADDPTYLFHALVDNRQQLPEIVLDACAAFIERCTEKARDIRTTFGTDADNVSTLIFRAYAQLRRPESRMRALALIDQMCLEGLRSAGKNLEDFER